MAVMIRFYRDVLRFEMKEDENTTNYEIAWSVENYAAVDKAYADVRKAGAESILEPATKPWGQRTCYIADPEGNLIETGSFTE